MKNKCTPINSGCTGDNIHLFFYISFSMVKICLPMTGQCWRKKEIWWKISKKFDCSQLPLALNNTKVKIYLKYSSWIYAKEKKLNLVWPIWFKKKKLTKTTVAPNMRMMKNVYKRYVMPLIKSKMKTVNWKKKKKIEYILAKYFLFSFSWKIFHRNKWQQVKYTFCCKKDKTKTGSLLTMNILHLFINYQILTNEINTPGIKFLF